MKDLFRRFSHLTSLAMGSPWAFVSAIAVVLVWAISGPIFHFSDTWQLVINTGTTIVTFAMVFLIQNTQNRDAAALHLKLDELIRAVNGARSEIFIDLEEKSDDELARVKREIETACDICHSSEPHTHTTEEHAGHLRFATQFARASQTHRCARDLNNNVR